MPSHDIINIAVPSLIVVKVGVDGIGDNHQFFVSDGHALAVWILARHLFEGVLREVAAVGLLAVDEQDGRLNLVRPCQQGLVEERLTADDVPAVRTDQRTVP